MWTLETCNFANSESGERTATRIWTGRSEVRYPVGERILSFLEIIHSIYVARQPSYNGYLGEFPPGIKTIKAWDLPLTSAVEIQNAWSYTTTAPICLLGVCKFKFTISVSAVHLQIWSTEPCWMVFITPKLNVLIVLWVDKKQCQKIRLALLAIHNRLNRGYTNQWQACLYYGARGHISKLCLPYKNHTILHAFRYTPYCYVATCGLRTDPQ